MISASFSPDSKWVVTGSWDKTARVWEASSGRLIAILQGHTTRLFDASFSPDGKWVVTASDDKTPLVYPWEMFAPIEEILDLAQKRILRELTPEEQEKYLHQSQSKSVESAPKR